jgi:hypothetical protein
MNNEYDLEYFNRVVEIPFEDYLQKVSKDATIYNDSLVKIEHIITILNTNNSLTIKLSNEIFIIRFNDKPTLLMQDKVEKFNLSADITVSAKAHILSNATLRSMLLHAFYDVGISISNPQELLDNLNKN